MHLPNENRNSKAGTSEEEGGVGEAPKTEESGEKRS